MEQTFIMIKHDGSREAFLLVGEVIGRFEKKGFSLKGLKLITVERSFAEKHYADLSAKPFFNGLVEYIISGPVVAMVWEGKNVVTDDIEIALWFPEGPVSWSSSLHPWIYG
uniref:nucleoside-diphosphate kinase n=1 Tax=Manihot esculenta TaxID=3983 RepID=A0A2C9WQX0_MANES